MQGVRRVLLGARVPTRSRAEELREKFENLRDLLLLVEQTQEFAEDIENILQEVDARDSCARIEAIARPKKAEKDERSREREGAHGRWRKNSDGSTTFYVDIPHKGRADRVDAVKQTLIDLGHTVLGIWPTSGDNRVLKHAFKCAHKIDGVPRP